MNIKRYTFENDTDQALIAMLKARDSDSYEAYETVVRSVIDTVKAKGDAALLNYTKAFDKVELSALTVTQAEIQAAYDLVEPQVIDAMKLSAKRIAQFHQKQVQNSWFDTDENGTLLGQKVTPLASVGVYVPGGKNAYPSSVLMNIVPAKVAGVKRIVMVTPPINGSDGAINPATLVAADLAGATEIYKVGGAQAIAALAYGTKTIAPVTKITGPGNIYVALAKKAVYGKVGIDAIAGPSEILIIADETANPEFIAADLLSQAEHDELASSILITTCDALVSQVYDALKTQVATLPRKAVALAALETYGALITVPDLKTAIAISDAIAPEHLEICTKDPYGVMHQIQHAGAIFLGHYTPEPLGDYMAGPNHVLPTNGTAKFSSPLSVDDFVKKSSILSFSAEGLNVLGAMTMTFARGEDLEAHARSIEVRLKEKGDLG